jgi:hypothetical protein
MERRPQNCVTCHKPALCIAFHEDPKTGERLGPYCPRCRPRTAERFALEHFDPRLTCEVGCEDCFYTTKIKILKERETK